MAKTKTTAQFVKDAKEVHGERYMYDLVKYVHSAIEVSIKCPRHGVFKQVPTVHLMGSGCTQCHHDEIREAYSLGKEEFIIKARSKHGDAYDYTEVVYTNNKTKVKIICKIHGAFMQTPSLHANKGNGCPKCARAKHRGNLIGRNAKTTRQFIGDAIRIHGDKYDYSKVKYVNVQTKVSIFCKKHKSTFSIRPKNHLNGQGCRACGLEKRVASQTKSTNKFIAEAKSIHGNTYIYDKTRYVNTKTKVKIKCRTHGEFLQLPFGHLYGSGCPSCNASSGEVRVFDVLTSMGISFETQKRFPDCQDVCPLPFDFYWTLDGESFLLEYHGEHHYEPVGFFGGKSGFIDRCHKDKIKKKFANDNGFRFVVIPYWKYSEIEEILYKEITTRNPRR